MDDRWNRNFMQCIFQWSADSVFSETCRLAIAEWGKKG